MSDAGRKRRLEELQVGSLGVLAMGTAYQPEVALKVSRGALAGPDRCVLDIHARSHVEYRARCRSGSWCTL